MLENKKLIMIEDVLGSESEAEAEEIYKRMKMNEKKKKSAYDYLSKYVLIPLLVYAKLCQKHKVILVVRIILLCIQIILFFTLNSFKEYIVIILIPIFLYGIANILYSLYFGSNNFQDPELAFACCDERNHLLISTFELFSLIYYVIGNLVFFLTVESSLGSVLLIISYVVIMIVDPFIIIMVNVIIGVSFAVSGAIFVGLTFCCINYGEKKPMKQLKHIAPNKRKKGNKVPPRPSIEAEEDFKDFHPSGKSKLRTMATPNLELDTTQSKILRSGNNQDNPDNPDSSWEERKASIKLSMQPHLESFSQETGHPSRVLHPNLSLEAIDGSKQGIFDTFGGIEQREGELVTEEKKVGGELPHFGGEGGGDISVEADADNKQGVTYQTVNISSQPMLPCQNTGIYVEDTLEVRTQEIINAPPTHFLRKTGELGENINMPKKPFVCGICGLQIGQGKAKIPLPHCSHLAHPSCLNKLAEDSLAHCTLCSTSDG